MKPANIFKGLSSEEVRLLLILGAGSFLLSSSLNGINIALPSIQREFDVSLSSLKWVSIIGAIMMASLSLCFGRIGDIVGRRRVYKTGMLVYAVGAGLSATAMSFPHLMAVRVIMALGLAMANPLAAAIMAATVNPERRGQVLGLFASFMAAGALTGPTLGGFILDVSSWRAIFVMNMALGFCLCIAQHYFLTGVDEKRKEVFDFWGAGLLLAGYPAFLIALSVGPRTGWSSPLTLFWFAFAVVGLSLFFWRESRFSAPLFRFSFFRSAPFCIAMFTLAVGSFVQSPITLFTPLFLQKVQGISPFHVGLIMMALPISTLVAGPIGGRLADRYNPRVVAAGGVAITFVAVFFYSRLGVNTSIALAVWSLALIGLGGALFRPANQVAVFATFDRREYGSLSAILTSLGTLFGTLGTTITVAINESRTSSNDAAAFASGMQFTFTALLPLLLASVFVSLLGRSMVRQEPATPAPTATATIAVDSTPR